MNLTVDDIVALLELEGEKNKAGAFVATFETADEFSNIYNEVSSDNSYSLDDVSKADTHKAAFIFYNAFVELSFKADFDKDEYTLTISEK